MKITLTELKALDASAIILLEIISMEGRYYMARVHLAEGVRILADEHGSALLYSGTWAIQDDLRGFKIPRTEVLPPAGYDEMVGMPDSPADPMRVPVQRTKP